MAIDPETQTENAPFTHGQNVEICAEHHLVQWFEKGQTWADVGSVKAEHGRECHENDPGD